jgi:hypothetical protein
MYIPEKPNPSPLPPTFLDWKHVIANDWMVETDDAIYAAYYLSIFNIYTLHYYPKNSQAQPGHLGDFNTIFFTSFRSKFFAKTFAQQHYDKLKELK